ncbi:MAG TPA: UDP-N-acetylmuramate dehydrogenase [Acidisarcina sp.]
MEFREHVPLAPYTTLKIGGPARWFAEATTEEELVEGVDFARSHDLRLFALGGGSNLLVSDAGFPGLVLHMALKGIDEDGDGDTCLFSAAAGEDWDAFVDHAVERNCAGIECLAGIPGSIGGTPVQNVGAYGQEVSSTIDSVRAYDTVSRRFVRLSNSECGFRYRQSVFNTRAPGRYIVTSVSYRLTSDATATVRYKDLVDYFTGRPRPGLADTSRAVREIRRRKGMVITPGDPDSRSAGSFFKNPVVDVAVLERLRLSHPELQGQVPSYPAGDDMVKIPAAWLLEQAGFYKGYELGQAGISHRHTLALINRGNATAAEIGELRDEIKRAVMEKFDIVLEPEPVWVG